MDKTVFFIVGNAKSGTTTIHNLLKNHPEVFLPRYKELKYFCKDLHRESDEYHGREVHYPIRTMEGYQGAYKNVKTGQIRGEVTPHYTFSKEAAKNIYDYNKGAKIIILLREPVSFLHSLHREFIVRFTEEEEDVLVALELEEKRKKGVDIPKKAPAPSYLEYSRWVNYFEQVKRYVNLFGKSNVRIFFLEDIAKNEREVLSKIMEFIGVDDVNFYPEGKVFRNERKAPRFKNVMRIFKHSILWRLLRRFTPYKAYEFLDSLFMKIMYSEGERNRLNPEIEKQLKDKYRGQVSRLNEYLNNEGIIDVNLLYFWGYEDNED